MDRKLEQVPTIFKKENASDAKANFLLGSIPFIVLVLVWLAFSRWPIPSLAIAIPPLDKTIESLFRDLAGGIYSHMLVTVQEVMLGLLFAGTGGIVLGTMIGLSRTLNAIFYPAIVVIQSIPKLALAPLLVVIFGFGIASKVAVAAMVAFFPILVGVSLGMRSIRLDEIDLMRSLNAGPIKTFVKVRVPRALPATFGGFSVGIIMALLGAVVTEFLGANAGLGYLIQFRSSRLDMPGMFSALIVLSVIGLTLSAALNFMTAQLAEWEEQ